MEAPMETVEAADKLRLCWVSRERDVLQVTSSFHAEEVTNPSGPHPLVFIINGEVNLRLNSRGQLPSLLESVKDKLLDHLLVGGVKVLGELSSHHLEAPLKGESIDLLVDLHVEYLRWFSWLGLGPMPIQAFPCLIQAGATLRTLYSLI